MYRYMTTCASLKTEPDKRGRIPNTEVDRYQMQKVSKRQNLHSFTEIENIIQSR